MNHKIKVGILGVTGKVGRVIAPALQNDPDLEFTVGLNSSSDKKELISTQTQVCVDFTTPEVVLENLNFLIENKIHAVVGTSGFDKVKIDEVKRRLEVYPEVGVVIVPNFAIGAILAIKFSEIAAEYFPEAEIIEVHNPNKIDAPSGTAINTANMIATARKAAKISTSVLHPKVGYKEARGAIIAGVPVHSVRISGVVAQEEIIFSNGNENLRIQHTSMNRNSFIPGVLLAIKNIKNNPGLTLGLSDFLGL